MRNYLKRLYDSGKILIESKDIPFDSNFQIEGDAINLRLHPEALRIKQNITEISIFDGYERIKRNFEEVWIDPNNGYDLKPGEVIFARTLETICIRSKQYLGLVLGRPTFSGFGLSISFEQSKFPADLLWNFPLQIKNNNQNVSIKLFPGISIAQLIIIEYPGSITKGYKGSYNNQIDEFIPNIDTNEQKAIIDVCGKISSLKNENHKINEKNEILKIFAEKQNIMNRQRVIYKIFDALKSIIDAVLYICIGVMSTLISQPLSRKHIIVGIVIIILCFLKLIKVIK